MGKLKIKNEKLKTKNRNSKRNKAAAKALTRKLLISLGIPTVFIPGLILASVLGWEWKRDLGRLGKIGGDGGYKGSEIIFPEKGLVGEVLDGDTFELGSGQTVRMIGIDAPNRGQEGYDEGKEYLKDLIEGEEVRLEYDAYQDDKFGRLLAYVWEKCQTSLGCKDEERMINLVLVKKGKAKVVIYEDRRKLKYQEELLEAERRD